jgi:hypothetical protein
VATPRRNIVDSSTSGAAALAAQTGAKVNSSTTISLSSFAAEDALRRALRDAQVANNAGLHIQLGLNLAVLSNSLSDVSTEVKKMKDAERAVLERGATLIDGGVMGILNRSKPVSELKAEIEKLKEKVKDAKFVSKKGQVDEIDSQLKTILGQP